MAAEAVTKTPGVGSETRDHFEVIEEKQPSKNKEPQERGENAQPDLSKYEQERSHALPRLVSPKPKLVKSHTWRSASQEQEASSSYVGVIPGPCDAL